MTNYGYARCSTNDTKQDIDRQVRELKAAGAEAIFTEYEHGDSAEKAQLNAMLDVVKAGDTVITLEVSRLTRSTKQLCELIEIIKAKMIRLVIVGSITIDCRNGELDPMTAAFLQMAGVFAELELKMIRARVKSGMDKAKADGKQIGRKATTKDDIPDVFYKHYPAFKAKQLNKVEFARVCAMSRPTIDKYIKLVEGAAE